MEDVVINLRRRHRTSRVLIGSDLNVSLAPSLEGLTGSRTQSNANGAPSRWRGAVTEWMHSLLLRALCTFDQGLSLPHVEWDHDACWTHKNSNKGGVIQLDYMLVSEHVHGEACVVWGPLWPRLMCRVLLMESNMMMLRKLCFRKVFILNPSALFCANPVISRVELICLVLRCRLPSCMIVVLDRVAWKALTCGIRYWTTHSANLQVAGKRMVWASCLPETTAKPNRGAMVLLVTP